MSAWPFRRTPPPGVARADQDAEIREELELYLELRTEELIGQGMTPERARREAVARFGDPDEVARRTRREDAKAARHGGWTRMGHVWQDLRYALRTLGRSPGFTLMATLTLAVALAGNTAVFSVLDSAVLAALPFEDANGLVFVEGYHLQDGQRAVRYASVPEFRDWRERSRTIDPMVAVDPNGVTLGVGERAERAVAEVVSEGYFDLLGGAARLGRTFTPEEYETPDGYPVVVLSHSLWERSFGADPSAVGRTLEVNERSVTIVGVMPEEFVGAGLTVDLWIPLGMISLVASTARLDDRETRFLQVAGRLSPGSDRVDAQRELDTIAGDLQALFPDLNENRFAQVVPFRESFLGPTGRLLWVLFGAGALLLLIASANVANLLLVRANARTREMVVRRALGAPSSRVAGQLLTESVVLAALGGMLGLALVAWGLGALAPLVPQGVLPGYAEATLSPRAFGFTLVVLTAVGLASGSAPALASSRRDVAAGLRSGGRGLAGGRGRAQQIFVVTQVGLALLLLVGAGLLTRSFRAQLAVDPGLETEGVWAFSVQPPRERYPNAASLRTFTDELMRRLSEVPGIESVAVSSDFPFRGGSSGSYIARQDDPETLIRYHRHSVTPGYFQTLGIELRAGRFLESSDHELSTGVAVVTQALVDRVFPEGSGGVGESIWVGPPGNPANLAEIVGVVENVRYRNLTQSMMDEPNSPDVFFSMRQIPSRSLEVSFRLSGDDASVAAAIRDVVRSLDPAIPVFALASLRDLYRAQTATPRFAAFLMGLFSVLALSLACVGIYGVLSFTVGQRGPEIALRRALGARAGDVARSVVLDGVRLALVGMVLGGGGALVGARALRGLLFEVEPTDVPTLTLVSAGMLAVALVAAAVPAWRASRRAPAEVLGGE